MSVAAVNSTAAASSGRTELEDLVLFQYSASEVVGLSVLLYTISAVGVTSNLLLVYNIVREPSFHTVGYMFMAHLACAEVIESACLVLLGHSLSLYHHIHGNMGALVRWHMDLLGMILVFGYETSVGIMLVLSVNRLCSVVLYATYRFTFTKRRSYYILAAVYTFTVLYVLPQIPVVGTSSYAYFPKLWGFALDASPRYPWAFGLFIGQQVIAVSVVLAMIAMYAVIFIKLRALNKTRVANATTESSTTNKPKREDILLTVQFFIVTMVYVTFWISLGVYEQGMQIITNAEGRKWMTTAKNIMSAVNCNVNPLVYMIINKRIRKRILLTASCGFCKGEDRLAGDSSGQASGSGMTNKTDARTAAAALTACLSLNDR